MGITINVAIADDHALFRKGLVSLLHMTSDLRVIADESNGEKLLKAIEDRQPDVVLLDLEMPVMDGRMTLDALKSHYPEIKIILLTMHNDERSVVNFMTAGANGYLVKSAHPEEVEEAIRKVVDSGHYMNDSVSHILLKELGQRKGGVERLKNSDALSERDIEMIRLICQEHNTKEIADIMFLSPRTVEGYRKKLLQKTGTRNAAGLAVYAGKMGLLD